MMNNASVITRANGKPFVTPSSWYTYPTLINDKDNLLIAAELGSCISSFSFTHHIVLTYDPRSPTLEKLKARLGNPSGKALTGALAKEVSEWNARRKGFRSGLSTQSAFMKDGDNFRRQLIQKQGKGKCPTIIVLEDYPDHPHIHLLMSNVLLSPEELQGLFLKGTIDVTTHVDDGTWNTNQVMYLMKTMFDQDDWDSRFRMMGIKNLR